MKILLKRNHQLFQYQTVFGSTLAFSPNMSVDAGFLDAQPIGDVKCTCYTADKVKSGDTGKKYDHTWLWEQMVQAGKTSSGGASPQDAFSLAVKGQKRLTGEIDDSAAYFQADLGKYDFFTNVKSAIQTEYDKGLKRPIGVGTYWYAEWNVGVNGMMPKGQLHVSDHEWVVCGWDEQHPDMFKIDAHIGYYMYMPREVFNSAMDATYGSVALTLAETDQERIDFLKDNSYSIIQSIIDYIYNALKVIQAQINSLKTVPEPIKDIYTEVKDSLKDTMIEKWAKAIAEWEGDKTGVNPGNLKYTSLTQSWGATRGRQATDGGHFASFANYDAGFKALCNFLTLGCKDELKDFHNARTLGKFMTIYAGNPPQTYLNGIASILGVTLDANIYYFL